MKFIFLYPLCILSLVLYLLFLRYTNFYKYTKISTEVALKIHTILMVFYIICLILLFVYTVIHYGAKVVAEGLEVVYHQLDPEIKKQLLEAAGGYKNPPDNPTSEHLMDNTKQVTTQKFTCVNPAKSFDAFVKLREAAGVPIPVEEKVIGKVALYLSGGYETICLPNHGTPTYNQFLGIPNTTPPTPDSPTTPTNPGNPWNPF